jgi:hypothetical protein
MVKAEKIEFPPVLTVPRIYTLENLADVQGSSIVKFP